MTREEAITVLEGLSDNPLFSNQHKAAFNIAIHDIKQRHDWDINNLILINKNDYEPLEQEPILDRLKADIENEIRFWQEPSKYGDVDKRVRVAKVASYKHMLELIESIKALEQEPNTKENLGVDCISREQALNEFCIYNPYDSIGVDKVRSCLKALPSIRPKGHWIDERNDYGEIIHWHCSNCYDDSGYTTTCKWDYCPNCGADMREVEKMRGLIYIVIDSREDDGINTGYYIDSAWTSKRKAQKRCDELNANLEKEPIWGVGLYQVEQKWIQK